MALLSLKLSRVEASGVRWRQYCVGASTLMCNHQIRTNSLEATVASKTVGLGVPSKVPVLQGTTTSTKPPVWDAVEK